MGRCFDCNQYHDMLIHVNYQGEDKLICLYCLFHRMPKCQYEVEIKKAFPDYSMPWNKK